MTEMEQKGYDTWIEQWCNQGCSPSLTECPARHMKDGPEREQFKSGWMKARREYQHGDQ